MSEGSQGGIVRSAGRAPTRRDVITLCAGIAALGMVPAPDSAFASEGEVYAFHGSEFKTLVFAVSVRLSESASARVRVHTRGPSWEVFIGERLPEITKLPAGARSFVGWTPEPKPRHLVVIETPAAALPRGELAVWAEIFGVGGGRYRVGGPIAARLLAEVPTVAQIYHTADPAHDCGLFGKTLSERIAARSADPNSLGATVRSERLLKVLLPDALPFDPERPAGFSFANQNGRRPSDYVADIIATILAGVPTRAAPTSMPFEETGVFPYFECA